MVFKIIEVGDGQFGIEKVWEYMFDFIVSDVMMFCKNGYEVCVVFKSDVCMSYILVILFIVKVEQEEKLQGLCIGVDDYLAKFFDVEELWVWIYNFI